MINYLSAHRATIIAIIGVVLTYLTAKYGSTAGPVQDALQLVIPVSAVLGVHISPSPPPVTPTAAPQVLTIDTNEGGK